MKEWLCLEKKFSDQEKLKIKFFDDEFNQMNLKKKHCISIQTEKKCRCKAITVLQYPLEHTHIHVCVCAHTIFCKFLISKTMCNINLKDCMLQQCEQYPGNRVKNFLVIVFHAIHE